MDNISRKSLIENCQTGDILLYNSKYTIGRLIEYFTKSKFSHISVILRDPTYIDPLLKGLYVIESGSEKIKDAMSGKKVIGVQVIPLNYVLDQYDGGYIGNLYYRKLDCKRDDTFLNKIKEIVRATDTKPYDLNPIDWIKAAFDIEIGDCQKDNTFWCSALVSYIYIKLGFLPEKLPWTIIAPKKFSYYEEDCLKFKDCDVEKEKLVVYTN